VTSSNSISEHEQRAALARRAFTVELDNAATVTGESVRQSARRLVPFVYGAVFFGALLGIVAVARLTRPRPQALVKITLPPAAPPRARSPLVEGLLRGPLLRATAFAVARLVLRRLAASPRLSAGPLLPALTSAALSSLASLQNGDERAFSSGRRGEAPRA
jgi:hypothetical protein